MRKSTNTQPLYGEGGKKVANVKIDAHGRKYSYREVDPERHILRSHDAICYDSQAVTAAEQQGIEYHVIKWTDTGEQQHVLQEDLAAAPEVFAGRKLQRAVDLNDWKQNASPPLIPVEAAPVSPAEEVADAD